MSTTDAHDICNKSYQKLMKLCRYLVTGKTRDAMDYITRFQQFPFNFPTPEMQLKDLLKREQTGLINCISLATKLEMFSF